MRAEPTTADPVVGWRSGRSWSAQTATMYLLSWLWSVQQLTCEPDTGRTPGQRPTLTTSTLSETAARMSIHWTLIAGFLYAEIGVILLLLVPFISTR